MGVVENAALKWAAKRQLWAAAAFSAARRMAEGYTVQQMAANWELRAAARSSAVLSMAEGPCGTEKNGGKEALGSNSRCYKYREEMKVETQEGGQHKNREEKQRCAFLLN
jgi:predicted component of type VI protein secretion system